MALTSSGQLSLLDIAGEFGGSTPHAMSEYRRDEVLVKSGHAANADIPTTSSNIQFSDFHGALNVYETVGLSQGSTITGDDYGEGSSSAKVAYGWIYWFIWSDGTDTYVSVHTKGSETSSYPSGSESPGSYNGTTIYTVNLGGNYYCKATASNHVENISGGTITINNDFSSYIPITASTEAGAHYYKIVAYANATSNDPSRSAGATGRLTFDFNSAGGATADLSIYWDYNAYAESNYEED